MKEKERDGWKDREYRRVLAVSGTFKGQVLEGWTDPKNKVFHLSKNYWCENRGAFRVDCLECGDCPRATDVIRAPEGVEDGSIKMELMLKKVEKKEASMILVLLYNLGFKPEYDIRLRMNLGAGIYFRAIYRGKGEVTIVGEDEKGLFAKNLRLNVEFDEELPVIYEHRGGKLAGVLKTYVVRKILVGMVREWCRLNTDAVRILEKCRSMR